MLQEFETYAQNWIICFYVVRIITDNQYVDNKKVVYWCTCNDFWFSLIHFDAVQAVVLWSKGLEHLGCC